MIEYKLPKRPASLEFLPDGRLIANHIVQDREIIYDVQAGVVINVVPYSPLIPLKDLMFRGSKRHDEGIYNRTMEYIFEGETHIVTCVTCIESYRTDRTLFLNKFGYYMRVVDDRWDTETKYYHYVGAFNGRQTIKMKEINFDGVRPDNLAFGNDVNIFIAQWDKVGNPKQSLSLIYREGNSIPIWGENGKFFPRTPFALATAKNCVIMLARPSAKNLSPCAYFLDVQSGHIFKTMKFEYPISYVEISPDQLRAAFCVNKSIVVIDLD